MMHRLDPDTSVRGGAPGRACPTDGRTAPPTREPRPGPPIPRRPDPDAVLPALGRLVMEVLAGRRPLEQLRPILTPAVAARLASRLRDQYRTSAVPDDRVLVRSAATCWIGPDACEGVVIVDHGDRTTALAMRMERHGRRWRVAEVAGPEFAWAPIGPSRASERDRVDDTGMAEVIAGPWAALDGSVATA